MAIGDVGGQTRGCCHQGRALQQLFARIYDIQLLDRLLAFLHCHLMLKIVKGCFQIGGVSARVPRVTDLRDLKAEMNREQSQNESGVLRSA